MREKSGGKAEGCDSKAERRKAAAKARFPPVRKWDLNHSGGFGVEGGGVLGVAGLVMILSVFAIQTPSSPFLPEPLMRTPSTASENSAGSPSFLILVSCVILTLVSGFPARDLSVRVMVAVFTLAMVPRYSDALGLGGGAFVVGGAGAGCAMAG
jgi:hypothetical protein